MKLGTKIQILIPALLLIALGSSTAYSQDPLPAEKKKALHKFDPADVFPEEREVTRGRPRRKPRSERDEGTASASTRLRSLDLQQASTPTPTPQVAGRSASPGTAPSPTQTPLLETTPSVTPTPEATPETEEVQSSGIASAVGGDHPGAGPGFPLYFLLPMLGLVLFALIILIISLKKQLRTP
jgi:hypothetical protein